MHSNIYATCSWENGLVSQWRPGASYTADKLTIGRRFPKRSKWKRFQAQFLRVNFPLQNPRVSLAQVIGNGDG